MLDILYEDADIFVINKPAGLLSVPGRGEEKYDSVQSRCQTCVQEAVAVHRLDMATSGLLLIAKHKAAERHYKKQFAERRVEKHYIAVVYGEMENDSGDIHFPLITDWERRPRQKICYIQGKTAHTAYQVITRHNGNTRVSLEPYTGRSHQLRVHLAGIGHPIVGDEFYAQDYLPFNTSRLLLHAESLRVENLHGVLQYFHLMPDF
ncbi:MAG: pseudouridine synthase [Cardiobacteriaceae bacterium]|nr:pseudouridine synthase [Cardiobacteriaceae bacterium]